MSRTHPTPSARRPLAAIAALLAGLATGTAAAATSQTVGQGTMAYAPAVGGPATVLMRTLTIAPGEVLGWHHHPGVGAYTVVVSGSLVVEDGCGGETTYAQGEAFLEPPNRVHRGRNPTAANTVTAQTFIVPLGSPTSVSHAQRQCGVPQTMQECAGDGWRQFTVPRDFLHRGDCIRFVRTGR